MKDIIITLRFVSRQVWFRGTSTRLLLSEKSRWSNGVEASTTHLIGIGVGDWD